MSELEGDADGSVVRHIDFVYGFQRLVNVAHVRFLNSLPTQPIVQHRPLVDETGLGERGRRGGEKYEEFGGDRISQGARHETVRSTANENARENGGRCERR